MVYKKIDFFLFAERRQKLITLIQQQYKHIKKAKVLLFANFERDGWPFRQDASFYYFTGVEEPAAVVSIDVEEGSSTLFVPNFGKEREKWVADAIAPDKQKAQELQLSSIEYLGNQCTGYQCNPFFTHREYENLLQLLEKWAAEGYTIFTLNPTNGADYMEQRFVLQRIAQQNPWFNEILIDISLVVAQMRRKKSKREIEYLYKAIEITVDAYESALSVFQPGKKECEVQAAIEYTFIASGSSAAFTSIVATGKNGTILHYIKNEAIISSGDLVVIDIGARYNHYCADLTRTYPVSGTFSARQREIYSLVLETQTYIASLAKPGMWLSNKNYPDKSLNHLAKKYLEDRHYGHYFLHGIGHFLGLEVHDVGDYAQPLEEGDVITIEPGIYIPEESIGVRIEDDYWIVPDGAICLSEQLPKEPNDIEKSILDARRRK